MPQGILLLGAQHTSGGVMPPVAGMAAKGQRGPCALQSCADTGS